MAINSYRDLIAWQKSRSMVSTVYKLSATWPSDERFGLTAQIRRAVVSVPSNIAEGHGRRSPREFHRFLNIAHGSLMEVETQMYLAFDLSYVKEDDLDGVLHHAGEIGRIIHGLIRSTEQAARKV